jgi:integrase
VASLYWEGGSARVQWWDIHRKRQGIRLGKVTKKQAEDFKSKVDALEGALITGAALEPAIVLWIAELPQDVVNELAHKGLIEAKKATTLGKFLDEYLAGRPDVKRNTRLHGYYTMENLKTFFGAERKLETITAADADDFKLHLESLGQSSNTVSKRVRNARQFFRRAVKARLIPSNPFEDVKAPASANRERDFFVTRPMIEAILKACGDDVEWKVIFALARYAGLRTPSETLALRWGDVDFEAGRITVHVPKLEHLAGKATRIVPLFPELRGILEEAQRGDAAAEGAVYVVNDHRGDTRTNLRTQARRIIREAGLTPWEKTFQNMRASRETELMEVFPAHVVHQWIGHSRDVADKHYLQVTDAHFTKAAKLGAPLVQYPGQGPPESDPTGPQTDKDTLADAPVFASLSPDSAESYEQAGPPGIEPGTF